MNDFHHLQCVHADLVVDSAQHLTSGGHIRARTDVRVVISVCSI